MHPAGHEVEGASIVPCTKSVAQSVGGSADGSVAKQSSVMRASLVAPLNASTVASAAVVVSVVPGIVSFTYTIPLIDKLNDAALVCFNGATRIEIVTLLELKMHDVVISAEPVSKVR